jgi:hypothetical protein
VEDVDKHGETYWHRQHQLSEMFYCTMHEARLVETKIRDDARTKLKHLYPICKNVRFYDLQDTGMGFHGL